MISSKRDQEFSQRLFGGLREILEIDQGHVGSCKKATRRQYPRPSPVLSDPPISWCHTFMGHYKQALYCLSSLT